MKKNKPIKINSYKTRDERMKAITGFSLSEFFSLANLATLAFVIVDFAVLFSRWETVQTESWYMVALIAISSAMILDIPMMLAGKAIVEFQCKLREKSSMLLIVILSVTAFALVFGFSIWFSYVTRNATFQDAESSMVINSMADLAATESKDSLSVLVAALFSGVLPFGTSVASLVITLMTYKPIEVARKKILKSKTMAQNHRLHLRQGIAEHEALIDDGERELARQVKLFTQFKERVKAQELVRKQAYREALEEVCSPDDVNRIIESAKELNASYTFDETPDFAETKTVDGGVYPFDGDTAA